MGANPSYSAEKFPDVEQTDEKPRHWLKWPLRLLPSGSAIASGGEERSSYSNRSLNSDSTAILVFSLSGGASGHITLFRAGQIFPF